MFLLFPTKEEGRFPCSPGRSGSLRKPPQQTPTGCAPVGDPAVLPLPSALAESAPHPAAPRPLSQSSGLCLTPTSWAPARRGRLQVPCPQGSGAEDSGCQWEGPPELP